MRSWLNGTGWRAAGSVWLLLAACSTGTGAMHTDLDGWRYARISAVGDAIRPRATPAVDCRTVASADPHPRYAAVIYLEHYHLRHRVVALPAAGQFEAGERIYVNVTDCTIPATLHVAVASR